MVNPYASPGSDSFPPPLGGRVALFTPSQIGAAAFFGTLIAAAWLARANLVALGESRKAARVFFWGLGVTFALVGLSLVLPEEIPAVVYVVPQIVIAHHLSKREFEPKMGEHGRASNWRVAAVCAVVLTALCVVVVAVALALGEAGYEG